MGDWIVFAGGSENAYNYDGIGYDGEPSEPSAAVFGYHVPSGEWRELGLGTPSMDHRGIAHVGDELWIVGGMEAGRQVSAGVGRIRLPKLIQDTR